MNIGGIITEIRDEKAKAEADAEVKAEAKR